MEDWTSDQLSNQVAGFVLMIKAGPRQQDIMPITEEHTYVMEKVIEHMRVCGPLRKNQELLQKIVGSAMGELGFEPGL